MKTILKMTLVIAFAAFANTMLANGNLKVNLLPISGEKAIMDISTLSNSKFTITVTDEKNQIVFFKETAEPVEYYHKVYDFSDLQEGLYFLTVECNDLKSECQFEKRHGSIEVGKEKITLEPFFGYQDGIIRCTYLNFPKEKVKLSFYENDQLLYSKEIGRNFNVNEGLNVSKLGKGEYVAVLSAGNNEYYYPIEIK
ncbi:MAG: hypothetical protein WAO52_17900 [Prolixibacteraceae bacterium]